MKINIIEEEKSVFDYLIKRNLVKQYKKAKEYLFLGYLKQVDFKIREPK